MIMSEERFCFVIMGYGVKTDFSTGRELDLDKTYKNVIRPAVEEAGLKCIRADEIKHSGTIDVPMYKALISADVVIADLSTNNANAFYELGVRHALRPKTTIAISENQLKPPFDVSHTVIRQYEHLGSDIGYSEAVRFKNELVNLLKEITSHSEIDSPVYTYIRGLKPPIIEEQDHKYFEEISDSKENLSSIIKKALDALEKNDFSSSKTFLSVAKHLDPQNDFVKQKLVLATYKSESPSPIEALKEALSLLTELNLEMTTDPETLGLAGAILKRMWQQTDREEYLNEAIEKYEKGFYIKNDYYNGINLAFLYNLRGEKTDEKSYAIADYVIAERIRKKVIIICEALYDSKDFEYRGDKYWICATLEEAYYGIEDIVKYQKYKELSLSFAKENWERETTEKQIDRIKVLLENAPFKPEV